MSEIIDITERVRSGKTTAVAEVKAALARAKQHEDHHAFISMLEKQALKKAAQIDKKIAEILSRHPELVSGSSKDKNQILKQVQDDITNEVGRLAGVPYALKDNFLSTDGHTTAAAKMLENFSSPLTATCVKKIEAEGAICIGRTNLDAYAHGSSTENSYFGPTKNAFDKTRVAGGSSGGSAVAVGLGIVPFALGSDTGGSIRQPASFNNVVGIKPTYGMVSRFGVVAMASSTDSMGVLADSVADAEIVMDIMAGQDERDGTTWPDYFLQGKPLQGQADTGVKAIIFDIGDVLISDYLCALYNKYPKYHDKIQASYKPFHRGDLTLSQYSKVVANIVNDTQNNVVKLFQEIRPLLKRDEELFAAIEQWKKSYLIGVLSNIGDGVFENIFTPAEIKKYFDNVVLSYQEKLAKPDAEIYKLAAKRLGVKPNECVFVDNLQRNMIAAKDVGMQGVLFSDTKDAIADINQILKQVQDDEPSKKFKIGVIKECINDKVDDGVAKQVQQVIQKLKKQGHTVEEVSLPMYKYALAIYYIVVPAEVCSNLGRYDGIRYGYFDDSAKTLDQVYGTNRNIGFMPENKRRIMIGNYVLSSGFFDAYYLKAQKARTLLIQDFNKAFAKFDALISPVSPTPAFKLGSKTNDPVQMYLEDIMSVPASLAGLPAYSIPAGKTSAGLPVGVQIIGQKKADSLLFELAKEIEK
ncbi:HAD-IA family hydrolase [Candidatus Saccharibacteria bacterium]|nr:HAD-IA family hydrolase [Candidatus Saccharibacteria bacterium]